MITAQAARSMYQQPAYTLAEVEKSIRGRATTGDFTCFESKRWAGELTKTLQSQGFQVTINSIGDVIVSWKEAEKVA